MASLFLYFYFQFSCIFSAKCVACRWCRLIFLIHLTKYSFWMKYICIFIESTLAQASRQNYPSASGVCVPSSPSSCQQCHHSNLFLYFRFHPKSSSLPALSWPTRSIPLQTTVSKSLEHFTPLQQGQPGWLCPLPVRGWPMQGKTPPGRAWLAALLE